MDVLGRRATAPVGQAATGGLQRCLSAGWQATGEVHQSGWPSRPNDGAARFAQPITASPQSGHLADFQETDSFYGQSPPA